MPSNCIGADDRRAGRMVRDARHVAVRVHLRIVDHLDRATRSSTRSCPRPRAAPSGRRAVANRSRSTKSGCSSRARSRARLRGRVRRGSSSRCSSPSARHVGSQCRSWSSMLRLSQRSSPVRNEPTSTVPLSALPGECGVASTPQDRGRRRGRRRASRPRRRATTRRPPTASPVRSTLHERGRDAAREVRAARCVAERAARHHERRARPA